jgi:hypothetical protein
VTELQLGNTTYIQEQLLAILHEPVRANGLIILAHQEIAAKLNIANGAGRSCSQQTLTDADALIVDLVIPPTGDGYLGRETCRLSLGFLAATTKAPCALRAAIIRRQVRLRGRVRRRIRVRVRDG